MLKHILIIFVLFVDVKYTVILPQININME